jgi:glutamate/tyrosine decarboxylase-like PLP-dependent enzyme
VKSRTDSLRPLLTATLEHSLKYLDSLDDQPVAGTKPAAELRQALSRPLAQQGIAPEQIIEELVNDTNGGLHAIGGGRFFAWVNGGTLPAALAADWLTSAWDQNAAMFAVGPAAAIVEEIVGEWLKDLLGLPATASFALVTGSQMAHVTCLAAARNALLARQGWNAVEKGLFGAPPLRLLCSQAGHGSIERAVAMLGMGVGNMEPLATDTSGRVEPEALGGALRSSPGAPAIICLQAGDINTGAYDRFQELIPIARRYNTWIHIDGAIGLWAAASPKYSSLMRGAAQADSWTTDGHKWLNTPYDCGYAFVADAQAHRAAFTLQASYLVHATDARDQMDWNPEWSRRARGFATYAALRQLGRSGVAELVERCCDRATSIVTHIGQLPGVEVLAMPIINQGLVRFLSSKPGAADGDHDRHTDAVITAIRNDGVAFFTGTKWHGQRAMRISVSGWKTSEEDVDRVVESVKRVLQRLT